MNILHQIARAQNLVTGIDLGRRHAIVIERNNDVTALCTAALIAAQNGQVDQLRLVCETLFALGYLAGVDHPEDLGVFGEEIAQKEEDNEQRT